MCKKRPQTDTEYFMPSLTQRVECMRQDFERKVACRSTKMFHKKQLCSDVHESNSVIHELLLLDM